MQDDPRHARAHATRHRVGARIRALREERRWSQEHLAERAGISRQTMYRTELATHAATIDVLALIAEGLGVPLTDLVRDSE
ncbi:helix-turn-helix transcriptional regulator [Streptomyces sp. 71268]|uniref:helix-turn-helix transcriptional regulator n=1 Tax=Streptomyces sp. 71268 TaxID=3002640 RepID=UPI0023F7EEBB|nr:helix-turn-helix transcriptional regulator [Streptomyces sp. 71268]WEV27660.1 helix-turn-helix transcriptional regulator [Streptomyces sp. 71268]